MAPGGSLRWVGRLDMYRKVPAELLEGSRRGSLLSYLAVAALMGLFLFESGAYFRRRPVTDLTLDANKEARIRVNFNITMMDLKCDYTVIDVVSVLGVEQNISSFTSKWSVDAAGVRRRYQGRNREQRDIRLYDPAVGRELDAADDLYKNGESAISLDAETLQYALNEQEYVFVDFYASWCSHCRDLAPTWETLAQVMSDVAENIVSAQGHEYNDEQLAHAKKVELPVMIAKVDCVAHEALCAQQRIMGYPTLRLFVDGERWRGGDYIEDRTVISMVDWLEQIEHVHKSELGTDAEKNVAVARKTARQRMGLEDVSDSESEWAAKVMRHKQSLHHSWVEDDHPGCQLAGHLLMERAPGHFAIMARSPHHEIEARMTNVSHIVHELTIGDPIAYKMIERGQVALPKEVKNRFTPMNGFAYMNLDLHEAYHHYLKVITTNIDGLRYGKKDLKAYQILESSQLAFYRNDQVPSAKWILDLSPIAVSYRTTSRHWYQYVTSIMALIGGTFTVIGLIESSIGALVSRKKSPYRS